MDVFRGRPARAVSTAVSRKAASGISETSAELGIALGIAVLGSIGTAVYRNQVAGTVLAGVSPDAAQATRETLGGAVAAANQRPGERGVELLNTVREAFTQGLQVNAGLSALVAIGLAIMSATLLRHASTRWSPDSLPPDPERYGSSSRPAHAHAVERRLANNEHRTT
jgi:hypothetical protein